MAIDHAAIVQAQNSPAFQVLSRWGARDDAKFPHRAIISSHKPALPSMPPRAKNPVAKMPVAMTIAGSDPGGGAGLQADLKTFAAFRVSGFSAVTAIIAQNSARVVRVVPVAAALLKDQSATLLEEHAPDAVKTGALGSAENG